MLRTSFFLKQKEINNAKLFSLFGIRRLQPEATRRNSNCFKESIELQEREIGNSKPANGIGRHQNNFAEIEYASLEFREGHSMHLGDAFGYAT